MPVGYPTNAFFYKGEWYNTDGEGMPAMVVTNTFTGGIEISSGGAVLASSVQIDAIDNSVSVEV